MSIAEMVKEYRRVKKLSQAKYALLIGTNQTEVSFIERGFIPKVATVRKITKLYESIV